MTADAKKITDLIQRPGFKFSFEVSPDVDRVEISNLDVEPAFFAVTWHAKSHQCKDLNIEPLKIASFLRSNQKQVLMHLSCDLLKKHYLERVLAFLQEKGICNLFLVLGESYDAGSSDFESTLKLLKYIREISGNYFCIGVAGFCDCNSDKLLQLKEKIDAGADFIITQAFFDAEMYTTYSEKCAEIGINVPILAGIFTFENYKQLTTFVNMCRVKVSDDVLEYVKTNEEHKMSGVGVIKKLINTVRSDFPPTNFHFFTMNKLQNVANVIKQVQD